MQQLLMNPESFYQQRDARTHLVIAQPPEPVRLALTIAPVWKDSVVGQLTLYWLCSLVARMGRRYNQLELWLPPGVAEVPCRIPGLSAATLADALLGHLTGLDPFGEYLVYPRPARGAYVVAVGEMPSRAGGVVVCPRGWAAAIGKPGKLSPGAPPSGPPNPIGAALAAALGAASVYRHFNGALPNGRQDSLWLSALTSAVTTRACVAAAWPDEPPLPDELQIGRWLVVGAGALGGNVLEILGALQGLHGHVGIVDHDVVDISNLNRQVAALVSHVGAPKVAVAKRSLRGTSLEVALYHARYEQVVNASCRGGVSVESYDLVLSGVDQLATRASIQSDWPRHIVNAGTHGFSWRVSSHPVGGTGACLGCLAGLSQKSYLELRAPLGCAVGQPGVPVANAPMDSYSFVSFQAATFQAAAALRHALGLAGVDEHTADARTAAIALNLRALQREPSLSSELCLCRCDHPVVREYRHGKYSEVAYV